MANLSSKVTPSGVATAAQGAKADTAVQPNDNITLGDVTLGEVTATSFVGDGSALSNLPIPASGVQTFQAATSLTEGDLVKLNTDGTVSKIEKFIETTTEIPTLNQKYAWAYDKTNKKVVVVGNDSSGNLTAVVGSVLNGVITFGAAATISNYLNYGHINVAFNEATGGFLIFFRRHLSPYGSHAVAATVSGTTITFGSVYLVNNVNATDPVIGSNNNGQFVIQWSEYVSGYNARMVACTVSGTSISFGGISTIASGSYLGGSTLTYDSASGYYIQTYGVSSDDFATPQIRLVGVSGTSLSLYGLTSTNGLLVTSSAIDEVNNQIVLVGTKRPSGDFRPYISLANISGTIVVTGTPTLVSDTSGTANVSNSFAPTISVSGSSGLVSYAQASVARYAKKVGLTSGSVSISPDELPFDQNITRSKLINTDVPEKYFEVGTNVKLLNGNGSTANNWIGFSSFDVSSGQDVDITIGGGTATNLSGLTQGKKYAINLDNGNLEESTLSYDLVALSSTSAFILQNNTKGSSFELLAYINDPGTGYSALYLTDLNLRPFTALAISGQFQSTSYGSIGFNDTNNIISPSGSGSFSALVILDSKTIVGNYASGTSSSYEHNTTQNSTGFKLILNTGFFTGCDIKIHGVV